MTLDHTFFVTRDGFVLKVSVFWTNSRKVKQNEERFLFSNVVSKIKGEFVIKQYLQVQRVLKFEWLRKPKISTVFTGNSYCVQLQVDSFAGKFSELEVCSFSFSVVLTNQFKVGIRKKKSVWRVKNVERFGSNVI